MQVITKIMLGVLLMLTLKDANSQPPAQTQMLEVTYNKTVSLLFPTVIKSVDRGSRDVLAQKAKGVENVLQLKAARENFSETNLTVITADGEIHQFTVSYSNMPNTLIVDASSPANGEGNSKQPLIFQTDLTESDMEMYSENILDRKPTIKFIKERNHKMQLSLRGIYIHNNVIFYHFRIKNNSNINYDLDFNRFYIHDQSKVKRTASQEVEVKPIYVFGSNKFIKGKSSEDVVYAMEKFTIPDAKHLVIEMYEKNGGRNLNLFIKNRTIVNARLIE